MKNASKPIADPEESWVVVGETGSGKYGIEHGQCSHQLVGNSMIWSYVTYEIAWGFGFVGGCRVTSSRLIVLSSKVVSR